MIDENKFTFQEGVSPLRQIRNTLGLSQEQFGQLIGVTGHTIYTWETDQKKVPRFTLSQVKKFQRAIKPLGLELDDVPDFLGPPPAQPN